MNNQNSITALKEKLAAEISKENSDSNVILALSNEIANLDESLVRFSIDAGLIDRLGKELVARQETAVSELVKNAYDADATDVKITFTNSDEIGGSLTIQDNGDGMDRNELLNGFMRISSTDKMHNPYSKNYKRRRAGQKGIGRFAVQRLGSGLTIVTQTESSDQALQLTIHWDDYQGDLNLTSITNSLKLIPKIRERGTTLFISGLREKWGERAISRIYNYVSDILQPYRLTPETEENETIRISTTQDPGFKFDFIKVTEGKPKKITNEIVSFYNHALAIVEGYVGENGIGVYTGGYPKSGHFFLSKVATYNAPKWSAHFGQK